MSGKAEEVNLVAEERQQLEAWLRASTTEHRLVQRARIVLESAAGRMTKEIARDLAMRPGTVSKWRLRFSEQRIAGLTDAPRGRGRQKYDEATEKRILATLDHPCPEGYARWSGKLLAKSLGDVSDDQVWRVLRKHGIHLQRRRSWCVSTDTRSLLRRRQISWASILSRRRMPWLSASMKSLPFRRWSVPRDGCAFLMGLHL